MDIIEILKDDYQRFPINQTYSLYTADVYFKDPLNEFRGMWFLRFSDRAPDQAWIKVLVLQH